MSELEKIISICSAYKDCLFNIEEFQHRLETVYLPDEYKSTLEIDQYNAHNHLEEIRFSYSEREQKYHADRVADSLIQVVQKYQESDLKNK
jgi:hypothetical protein